MQALVPIEDESKDRNCEQQHAAEGRPSVPDEITRVWNGPLHTGDLSRCESKRLRVGERVGVALGGEHALALFLRYCDDAVGYPARRFGLEADDISGFDGTDIDHSRDGHGPNGIGSAHASAGHDE